MKVILISNYIPDGQESMKRFAEMLHREYPTFGIETELWYPTVLFGSGFKSTNAGLGKWLGYIDKWILFPLILRWRVLVGGLNKPGVHFHIGDHSNSPYLAHLPSNQSLITCHDVIAIRAGLGFTDSNQQASSFGKILQRWILGNLKKAKRLATVSQFTLNQLKELAPEVKDKKWEVILNPFNAEFGPLSEAEKDRLLQNTGIKNGQKFILHIGSGLPRKNRPMLLKMVNELSDKWDGYICYAGDEPDSELLDTAKQYGLQDRVVYIIKPPHEVLRALYNACEAFVFPSFNEGFGWPLIEAQACGAPVIASNFEPMPEVSGGAAIHADPYKPQEFAEALLRLQDEHFRSELIAKGFENCKRFQMEKIMKQYIALHEAQVS
ncbi:glycosyltransferase family 4 protein [Mucilaginibacter terrae]|uniref:Glycosyltransferase involved in cell wall biosynthesis n=1 Tax=Mucilaginibacter terrae TaxID=1955052 RepID=A0ABU3GYD9_9SPHI|nr:glycosyltransferase family 1 protein [Mucilaginibacter terrae]MDT3404790.1 glycosyltransferase involved in cell wall biosynthesis [Mucilaginibacter terrae]